MTIVIAIRDGDQAILMADTMVGEPSGLRADVVPGRLKVVTVAPRLTVGYAGNADQAFGHLRQARRAFENAGVEEAIAALRRASADGHVDFLVAAHCPELKLVRLRRGGDLAIRDVCAIGDHDLLSDVIELGRAHPPGTSLRHSDARSKFIERMLTLAAGAGSVGGLPVAALAAGDSHSYLPCGGVYTFNLHMAWGRTTHQPKAGVMSGQDEWRFSILPPSVADVPVLAAYLPQALSGYIWSPLEDPRAVQVRLAEPGYDWVGAEQPMIDLLRGELDRHAERWMLTS